MKLKLICTVLSSNWNRKSVVSVMSCISVLIQESYDGWQSVCYPYSLGMILVPVYTGVQWWLVVCLPSVRGGSGNSAGMIQDWTSGAVNSTSCHSRYAAVSRSMFNICLCLRMLASLCVCAKEQICIWPNWCHCHSLYLAPVNPDWFYLPGFAFLVLAHPGSPEQNP